MSERNTIVYGSDKLPMRIGTLELTCYILTDGRGVFTRTSLQKALGYDGKSADWLFDLLSSVNKFYPVPGALFEALEHPIIADNHQLLLPEVVHEICVTILNAKNDGFLGVGQLKHAKAAAVIAAHFDHHDINYAIQDATGYNFAKDTAKDFLRDYLIRHDGDAMYKWIPVLRDSFWEKIFSIHLLNWHSLTSDPKNAAAILHEALFSRLNAHLAETLRSQTPKRVYRKAGKAPGNAEHPELQQFVSEVLSLLQASADNWAIFLQLINRVHPKSAGATLQLPDNPVPLPVANTLDNHLARAVSLNRVYKATKKRA